MGLASARKADEGRALREWLGHGYQAGMSWMDNAEVREDPARLLPGARSVVVVGLNCFAGARVPPGPGEGRIARYALLPDYHGLVKKGISRLLDAIRACTPCRGAAFVDAAPILERAYARRAGIGWIGKNACLIAPRFASWLLLGELILDLELDYDEPLPNRCGTCRRCLDACPTGAIVAPGVVDANRCIAYLTIEHRGAIPRDLRTAVGEWLFGCELCQEACPWIRFARRTRNEASRLPDAWPAAGLLAMPEGDFRAAFAGTPLFRTGRARMARNAAVVLGNTREASGGAALDMALADSDAIVRGHAAWALGRHGARESLGERLATEDDPVVMEEIRLALAGLAGGSD